MLKIKPEILEGGDIPPAWTEPDEDGVRFLLRFARTKERKAGLLTPEGETVGQDAAVKFWLDRVEDWDGVSDESGEPIAFSRERLEGLIDLEPEYASTIITEGQELANFFR